MKNVILISLLVSCIVLAGCSQSQDKLFQKKQECGKLSEQMQKDIDTIWPWIYFQLWTIYYSVNRNSCIYTVKWDFNKYIAVIDFSSKEVLYSVLNQYCWLVNGKIELGKTEDLYPFEWAVKNFIMDDNAIVWTDEPDCVQKIQEKYSIWMKVLDLK